MKQVFSLKAVLLLLSMFCINITTTAQWSSIYQTEIIIFTDLDFINDETGIIIGKGYGDGMILKTTNGNNFSPKFQTPGYELNTLYFINNTTGYAAGESGYIIKTTNYGETWTELSNPYIFNIQDICFTNQNVGFACGAQGIIKTTDGGDSWEISYTSGWNDEFYCIASNGDGTLVAGGKNGTLIYSVTNGQFWQQYGIVPGIHHINEIVFTSSNTAYACTAGGELLINTDIESPWERYSYIPGGDIHELHGIFIDDEGLIYVSGNNGLIAKSEDGGLHWEFMETGTEETISKLAYTQDDIGFATGLEGTILKDKNDLGISGIGSEKFTLYPHPVFDQLKISMPAAFQPLSVEIYNIEGNQVKMDGTEYLSVSNHLLQINLRSLHAGAYIIRLTDENKQVTLRFIKSTSN